MAASFATAVVRWSAMITLALIMAACAPTTPEIRPSTAPEPERLAAQGRHAEAAQAWMRIASSEPGRADDARLAAAAQWLAAGRPERAEELIAFLSSSPLNARQRVELDLLAAEAALLRGDGRAARELLAGLRDRILSAEQRARQDELLDLLAGIRPDSPEVRLRALREAVARPDFQPATALELMLDLPTAELEALNDAHGDQPSLAPWLDLALTARRHLLDDPRLAEALDDWRARYTMPLALPLRLLDWVRDWRARQPAPSRIALLLPGEGSLARVGAALGEGVLSAWLEQSAETRPELDILYLDDREDAAAGARFEALERGADLIIGPLPRNQIGPLLALPDGGVPTLLLNRPEPTTPPVSPARAVAMLALPPEEEAELAAVRALVGGMQRALVVEQDSDFGRRVADRFVETFELGGGRVFDRVEYQPDQFDHTDRLAGLLEVDRSEQRIERLGELLGEPVTSLPQRRGDVDLVFLATRGGDARQLMPQLRFFDLGEMPVYSTSDAWPGGAVGTDLDGLQFPAAPWQLRDGRWAGARQRAERINPALSGSPNLSLLHALGRDALTLAPWLDTMKRDPQLYLDGAVGRLRLADGVRLERDLPWARIEDGRPVRHAPESESPP